MPAVEQSESQNLVVAVNGERFELSSIDPATTLLEFLRTRTRFKGAKLGCGEGGCGACVVLLSKYDPISGCVEDFTVSSCLTLLCSIHFCSVTTTEGLGNIRDGFNSIHERIAGFHASQCGFCTPGMCMSIFSALNNADKTGRPEPPVGFSKLTMSEAEKVIAGNLCRCTGYRSIVDTCKSFASDVDMEDLGLNSFWRQGEANIDVRKLPFYHRDKICTFPEFLKSEIKASLESSYSSASLLQIQQLNISDKSKYSISSRVGCWYLPKSINDLQTLLKSEEFGSSVKLVAGNTSTGVYKEVDHYDKYIDLSYIPELSKIRRDISCIEIGAAVTISRAIEVLKEDKGGCVSVIFTKIANHMDKVASQFIRNTASIGGNIVMAQRGKFPSDIATILLAVNSSVCILMNSERLVLSLEEFFKSPPCDYRVLLLGIWIPTWNSVSKRGSVANDFVNNQLLKEPKLVFETYRAAPRPLGNAVAYVNAAFLAQISTQETSGKLVIDNLQLAFGAFGTRHAIRARKVEEFLVGKSVNESIMLDAIRLLKEIIIPEKGTEHPTYRISVAVGFLFEFLQQLCEKSTESGNISRTKPEGTISSAKFQNGCITASDNLASDGVMTDHPGHDTAFLSSKRVVEVSSDYRPIGLPIKKAGVELQASGEAVFVDDIPSPKDCLHGAFIYSTKPLVHVKDIKLNPTSASDKIISIISLKDIPNGGKNVGSGSIFGEDPLFACSFAECAGQPLCLVVAETQRLANAAAQQAEVIYEVGTVRPPILLVEEAVQKSSFFEVPPFIRPKQVGDFYKGMGEADHKIQSAEIILGSQYYFYMETQTALAIPDEGNCISVYSSSQCPEKAHDVISACLGIPNHNVRVITRRVGGGFGGKALKSVPVSMNLFLMFTLLLTI
uniref:Putative aldehyde oxidase 4 n=1 Tax=Anthurium amnicola TaxID=1678845 RepID=A0A1D1Y7W5_9ARAE